MGNLEEKYKQFIADVATLYECQEAIGPLQEGFDVLTESWGKKLATAALATAALAGHGHATETQVPFQHDDTQKAYSTQHSVQNPVDQIKNFSYKLQSHDAYEDALIKTAKTVQKQLLDVGTPEAGQHAQHIQDVMKSGLQSSFSDAPKVSWNDFTKNLHKAVDSARDYIEKSGNSDKATACTGGDYEDNLIQKAHALHDKLAKSGDANAKKLASNIQDALNIGFPVSFTDEHQNEKWEKMIPELNKAVAAAAHYLSK
jgi:hypothetical protein